jgi:hypothetical protein
MVADCLRVDLHVGVGVSFCLPTQSEPGPLTDWKRGNPSMGWGCPVLPCLRGLARLLTTAQVVNITALTGHSFT